MGYLSQSDLWEANKGYNIAATSASSRQTARATADIAQSNRAMVQQLEASLEMQRFSAQVQSYTASLVEQSNAILLNIGDELRSLGFEMRGVAGAVQNVESAVREQTDLHRKHYDAVQKEQALKEVIYNMKKYQTSLANSGDALAKAYGSKKLNDLIQQYGFSTRDLSSIQDKEYFDALKTECDRLWNAISEKERQSLQDMEKLHLVTRELLDADIEGIAREFLPLEKMKGGVTEPVLKKAAEPEIKKKYPKAFSDPTISTLIEKRKKTGRLMLYAIAGAVGCFLMSGVMAIGCGQAKLKDGKPVIHFMDQEQLLARMDKSGGVVTSIQKNEDVTLVGEPVSPAGEKWLQLKTSKGASGYVIGSKSHTTTTDAPWLFGFFLFLSLFVCPLAWIVLFFSWLGKGASIVSRSGLSAQMWKSINRTYEAQVQEQRRLDDQYRAQYKAELSEFRAKMEQAEGDIKRKNAEIEKRREALRMKHNAMLAEFRNSVNAFLNQHKPVQEFLPVL